MNRIHRLRAVVVASWRGVLGFLLLGLVSGASVLVTAPPRYDATTRVFVSADAVATPIEGLAASLYAQTRLLSYAAVVDDPVVLRPIAERFGIPVDELIDRVLARTEGGSLFIEVVASSSIPREAAELADAVAAQLEDVIELQLEGQVTATGGGIRAAIAAPAEVPLEPASPAPLPAITAGGFVGFVIGVGMLLLRRQFDVRLRRVEDLERLDRVVLAGIPRERRARADAVAVDPDGPAAHAMRALATALRFTMFDAPSRAVVLTSPGRGSGTTRLALQLAQAVAIEGGRALVVDANFDSPAVARLAGVAPGLGLMDALSGRADPAAVPRPMPGAPDVEVVTLGRATALSGDLLGSAALPAALAVWEREYDLVIFDAAPLERGADARVLAAAVGSAVVVVRLRHDRRDRLEAGLRMLPSRVVRGLVVTGAPRREEHIEYEMETA